jgi:hypothetical protein
LDFKEKETTTARAPPCHVMAEKSKRSSKEKREGWGHISMNKERQFRSDPRGRQRQRARARARAIGSIKNLCINS